MSINSPVAGVIEALMIEDGSSVQSGQAVFTIRVGATSDLKSASSDAASTAPSTASPQPSPSPLPSSTPPPSSTSTSPSSSETSFLEKSTSSTPPPVPPVPSAPLTQTPVSSFNVGAVDAMGQPLLSGSPRTEHRVKMNRMRLRIAQRLKDAQNTYAMLTTFNEIDMR